MFDLGFCWGIPITFMTLRKSPGLFSLMMAEGLPAYQTTSSKITGTILSNTSAVNLRPMFQSLASSSFGFHLSSYPLPPSYTPVRSFNPHSQPPSDISSGIALYHFVQMRVVFSSVLEVSSSPMSTNRYMCLIAMSVALMLWNTVVTSLTIWANTSRGLQPLASWKSVHSNWSHVDAYVWILMSPQSRRLALLFWWALPVSSVILFVFLGFDEDALKEYRRVGEAITSMIPSRVLPGRNEKFVKGMVLGSPLLSSRLRFALSPTSQSNLSHLLQCSSSKDLPPYSPNSSYFTPPMSACITKKTSNLKEFILPLPVTANTTSTPRATSTISISNSLSSLKPSRPATRSRAADSAFYFHPAASSSASIHSGITQFSMSDDSLAFGQPSTPLPANTSATSRSFQELPPIRPLQSLRSMMGLPHSRTQSPFLPKSNEQRRSARSEKLGPSPLRLGSTEDELSSRASGMAAEPRESLRSGAVQVTIQGRDPHDQV